MRNPLRRCLRIPLSAILLALTLVPAVVQAAVERPVERRFDAGTVKVLELENLVGRVSLTAAPAGSLRVAGQIHAEDSAGETAAALADSLKIEFVPQGDRMIVRALYPVDEHRRYHYPGQGADERNDSWLGSWVGGNSNVRYRGREVRVTSAGGSSAATLWADFQLEIPAGVTVLVKNSVGRIDSKGVAADQTLDTAAGDIEVETSRGALSADTGSGDIAVLDHQGNLTADTGSGDVTLERVTGDRIAADTGSGNVGLLDCTGSLLIDTGSGDIRGRGLMLGRDLEADTGSGDVRLAGDFSAVRNLVVDTGSGDVVLDVDAPPSVHLLVSTGSGEVQVDLPGTSVRNPKGDFVGNLGDGSGKGVIDTGSGDVRIIGR